MSAEDYAKLFRVWPMRADKTPLASGFGADKPEATWPPDRFKPELPVGILCGPLQPEFADTGRHVLGLDLDKAMTREKLEDALGVKLPDTLTSKGWRHAYYFIPADHPLHQRNGAITCEGGALDIRPCAGGYLLEKGDWDRGFDVGLIEDFPPAALAKLAQFIGEKRARDGAPPTPASVQISDRDRDIARELVSLWQPDTTGDRAFGGLGGWLARRGVSRDRTQAIAGFIAEACASKHPDPLARVDQAYDGDCPLGRPALAQALAQGIDEGAVQLVLDEVEELIKASVPGFAPPEEKPKKQGPWLTWSDLMAPLPKIDWLCRDLQLSPGRPAAVVAAPNVGKTWSLQALALAVASGQEVFGHFDCAQGPVLHVSTDAGEYATRWRYQMLAKGMGLDTRELQIKVWPGRLKCVNKYNAFDKAGLAPILDEAARGDYKLVILDSLFAIAAGLDMMAPEAAEPLWATRNLPGVWLWAMHSPKGKPGFYGSQAIGAACGAMWNISLDGEDTTKPRIWSLGRRVEEFQGTGCENFITDWEKTESPIGDLLSARVQWIDPSEAPSNAGLSVAARIADARARMLKALVENAARGLSEKQLQDVAGIARADFRPLLNLQVASGAVLRKPAGRSWMYHPGSSILLTGTQR